MKPKEKAKELVGRFYVSKISTNRLRKEESKQCALICVDVRIDAYTCPPNGGVQWGEDNEEYWQKVKTEIEKL